LEVGNIENLVRPVVEKSGYELYDLEFGGRVLRVFIEKEGGVSLQDCVEVTKLLGPLLDVEDVIPGSYELEVSSPGLERVLRKPHHFERSIGSKLKVKTREPMSRWNSSQVEEDKYYLNRHKLTGELKAVEGDSILMTADQRDTRIPIAEIQKAQIIFENEKQPKKGKKPHGR